MTWPGDKWFEGAAGGKQNLQRKGPLSPAGGGSVVSQFQAWTAPLTRRDWPKAATNYQSPSRLPKTQGRGPGQLECQCSHEGISQPPDGRRNRTDG